MLSEMSGATSLDTVTGQVRELLANEAVHTIVLDVDSRTQRWAAGSVVAASESPRRTVSASNAGWKESAVGPAA